MNNIVKETKHYYWEKVPVYEKYVDKENTSYCEDCGQPTGTYITQEGVNILRYEVKKRKKDWGYALAKSFDKYILPRMVENIMAPSIFDRWKGGKLTVPKIKKKTFNPAFPENPSEDWDEKDHAD
ncbi:MAG TPA: hypothetical protein VF941_03020 [Clostridia bacterium]